MSDPIRLDKYIEMLEEMLENNPVNTTHIKLEIISLINECKRTQAIQKIANLM